MTLMQLIKQEMGGIRRDVLAAAAISGVANSGILAIVNKAASTANYENLNFRYFAMFLITMAIYVISMRYTFEEAAKIFESMIDRIRLRISQKIRESELIQLEHIGKGLIFNRLVQDTSMISQFQGLLVSSLQSSVLVVCTAIYIASLSMLAFGIMVIVIIFATLVYYSKQKAYIRKLQEASDKEIELFGIITHLLDGFKQVKLNKKRGDSIEADFQIVSSQVRVSKVESVELYNVIYIFSQCVFFALMGIVVFILPRMSPTFGEVLVQLTASVLFIIGPLSTVVMGIPAFAKANVATENISQLEMLLDRNKRKKTAGMVPPNLENFKKVSLKELTFSYLDETNERLFQVGPLNLEIKQGEMIFIVGGNGSGKSTMLKMLTGLYQAQSGMLLLDDMPLIDERLDGYRELFSIIFGDFYLFDKLYGMGVVPIETVTDLIQTMGLTGKTLFDGERFTHLDLSTGQRKRLALIVALLEKKPIHIFDEWAADQDPEFRKYFYEEILVELKRKGKTVIAVTHDDKYFHVADRVLKMEYGRIEAIQTNDHSEAQDADQQA